MELILISAISGIAVVGYIISLFVLSKEAVRKLWLALFLVLFVISFGTLFFLNFKSNLLGSLKEMSEIYFAFFTVTFLLIIGVINLWIFKGIIFRVFRGKSLTFSDDK